MADAIAALEALTRADRVLLTGPSGPDGDSIGACLALAALLSERGVEALVLGNCPHRYRWLPGAEAMVSEEELGSQTFDLVVVVDGDRHRLTSAGAAAFAAARSTGIIDHHASTEADGYTWAWLDCVAASACEMIAGTLDAWQVPRTADLATLLYVGFIFDTGGFRHSNTTPQTHRLAAELLEAGVDHVGAHAKILYDRRQQGLRLLARSLASATLRLDGQLLMARVTLADLKDTQAVPGDIEGVVDVLANTEGVRVAALLIEREDAVKISLRSRDSIDVSHVAASLVPSGGGHPKAAGAVIALPIDRVAEGVERQVAHTMSHPEGQQ